MKRGARALMAKHGKNGKLAIIDFGDLTNSQLINEIAIAMTYASYDKKNPLDSASIVLNAYNKIIKLTDQEISIIYYLMAAKLCISVCNSAYSKKVNPKNTYALVSEKNAWSMLKYLIKTSSSSDLQKRLLITFIPYCSNNFCTITPSSNHV